jgi:hypothetical protein
MFSDKVSKLAGTQRSNIVCGDAVTKRAFVNFCDHWFRLFMMRSEAASGRHDS